MGKIFEDGHPILTYEESLSEIYWTQLSEYLRGKYSDQDFSNNELTETILKDAFQFLADKFKDILLLETSISFYMYAFYLHEESINLYFKTLEGYRFVGIQENEFALYRRILKLVLEQGCEIDLNWGTLSIRGARRQEIVLQHLIYIATWLYDLSDRIANCKMIENCYKIEIEDNLFTISLNNHFGLIFNTIPQLLEGQFEAAICDINAGEDVNNKIVECFGFAIGDFFSLVRTIQEHHNPRNPNIQSIEPYILPINLADLYDKDVELMKLFCNGLTINRANKPSLETTIYKPTDEYRYAFRPILVYNICGEERALIGENKLEETFQMLTTNALHWEGLPSEWQMVPEFKLFMDQKSNNHESTYLNKVKELVVGCEAIADYNVEVLKKKNNQNLNILSNPGEIDCIIVIPKYRRIIVADIKYNRSKYEAVGWQKDFSNFKNKYERKLKKKVDWIRDNRPILQEHFEVKLGLTDISLLDFSVEGCFLINTPTFYMFNGDFRAITIFELPQFLKGWLGTTIIDPGNRANRYDHPYFKLNV
ncbi:MAG: hypothetical protein Q8861_00370 [Bacteroidota bacterium]|nr:hypothetical protein [Bacteroidota bacterium]MDP4268537.1 hypothetical protein [Bacteroidota bacterium]